MAKRNAKAGRVGKKQPLPVALDTAEVRPTAEPETAPPEADTAPPAPKRKRQAKVAAPAKKLSALNAAAQVLEASAHPMTCQELIDAMTAQKLWTSPNGQTPASTLYAAIAREIKVKDDAVRFVKTERGKFAFRTQV